jgi:hypothetical protein
VEEREMAQFHMRYTLSVSVCPSSSNVSDNFFVLQSYFYFWEERQAVRLAHVVAGKPGRQKSVSFAVADYERRDEYLFNISHP